MRNWVVFLCATSLLGACVNQASETTTTTTYINGRKAVVEYTPASGPLGVETKITKVVVPAGSYDSSQKVSDPIVSPTSETQDVAELEGALPYGCHKKAPVMYRGDLICVRD